MKDCKHYDNEFDCCKVLSDWSDPMPVLQPCIESPCKYYESKGERERENQMTIELFKGEDDLLLEILGNEYKQMGLDERERALKIYKLIERIELTQKLYNNMYGRQL